MRKHLSLVPVLEKVAPTILELRTFSNELPCKKRMASGNKRRNSLPLMGDFKTISVELSEVVPKIRTVG